MTAEVSTREQELRVRAIKRLKKRRDFHGHVLVYLLVNAFLVAIWAVVTPEIFFWPIIPMAGWGIGVVMNAWEVYFAEEIGEEEIHREIERLEHRV